MDQAADKRSPDMQSTQLSEDANSQMRSQSPSYSNITSWDAELIPDNLHSQLAAPNSLDAPVFVEPNLVEATLELEAESEAKLEEADSSHACDRDSLNIPLLAERLHVETHRRKIGEVVVRKQIQTRIIEVPVRYETLVIEQVSPEAKQLAEVRCDVNEADAQVRLVAPAVIRGEFSSPRIASQVLYELGKTLPHRCRRISVEIELDDATLREAYQDWLDRFIKTAQTET